MNRPVLQLDHCPPNGDARPTRASIYADRQRTAHKHIDRHMGELCRLMGPPEGWPVELRVTLDRLWASLREARLHVWDPADWE